MTQTSYISVKIINPYKKKLTMTFSLYIFTFTAVDDLIFLALVALPSNRIKWMRFDKSKKRLS